MFLHEHLSRFEADEAIAAQIPHVRLELAMLDEDDERYQFLIRLALLLTLADALGWTLWKAQKTKDTPPTKAELEQAKHVSSALAIISKTGPKRRQRPRPGMEWARRFDTLAPRVAGVTARCVDLWLKGLIAQRAKEYRREREKASQQERQERLTRRKLRRAEAALIEPLPRAQSPKPKELVEREEAPRCGKCHKRPAVKDNLCDPCLKWERAKLGRT